VVIRAASGLKGMEPVVVNVKCDLQPGRTHCVVPKVRWSVVLWGLQAASFLHKEQYFTFLAFEQ